MLTVPSLIGSERTISLTYGSGPQSGAASTLVNPGRLSFSGGPVTTATLVAAYNLVAPIDFTVGGGDSFLVDIYSRDVAVGALVDVSVTSAAGMASATSPFSLGGTVLSIPFTQFVGVDFTQVTGYSVTINPDPAFDGSIRLVGVSDTDGVPEPSGSLALLAILAGAVARRRR